MLNKEKFAKEIIEIACRGQHMAVVNGKPTTCYDTIDCKGCIFHDGNNHICDNNIKEWANSEYVEPPIDWSKVSVDTPILARDYSNYNWERKHFARYENGVVYAWQNGATSWTANGEARCWKQAKLAESEE